MCVDKCSPEYFDSSNKCKESECGTNYPYVKGDACVTYDQCSTVDSFIIIDNNQNCLDVEPTADNTKYPYGLIYQVADYAHNVYKRVKACPYG